MIRIRCNWFYEIDQSGIILDYIQLINGENKYYLLRDCFNMVLKHELVLIFACLPFIIKSTPECPRCNYIQENCMTSQGNPENVYFVYNIQLYCGQHLNFVCLKNNENNLYWSPYNVCSEITTITTLIGHRVTTHNYESRYFLFHHSGIISFGCGIFVWIFVIIVALCCYKKSRFRNLKISDNVSKVCNEKILPV